MNNLYRLVMLQKLSVGGFQWVEETSQFNEDFINEDSDEDIFLKLKFNIWKNCINLIIIYCFYLKEQKLKMFKKHIIKKNMLCS